MKIVMYTGEGCSKCLLLKRMLISNNIDHTIIDDKVEVMRVATEIGSMELPIINIDGNYYSGTEAIKQVQGRI